MSDIAGGERAFRKLQYSGLSYSPGKMRLIVPFFANLFNARQTDSRAPQSKKSSVVNMAESGKEKILDNMFSAIVLIFA